MEYEHIFGQRILSEYNPFRGSGYNQEIKRGLITKMTFYIHPFVENTDDKNVPIGEWSIENEMVSGSESVQILCDVTI